MNRRQLLLRGALLATLAPVVRVAQAPEGTGAAADGVAADSGAGLIAVQDPAYRRSREFAAVLVERGARLVASGPDALALWHATLQPLCATLPATPRIAGLTTYTDFLVLRDSARRAGFVPLASQDPDAGRARRRATLIAWVLAPRTTVA